ncbi:hypothetical protein AVEN_174341-1, partial [Araneus ventricosus]
MKARLLLLERENNCRKTRLEERQDAIETLRREGTLRMERIHEEMADLAAIGFAADWALEHNKLVNIHTDSQSSIEAIKSVEPKSEFVNNVKENTHSFRLLVSLTWVKAHASNPGNERADRQAKLATTIGQYLDFPAPYSYVKLKI